MQTFTQLLTSFTPDHYTLSLNINRPERTFDGTVTITGHSLTNEPSITLHAKDLTIQSVTIDGKVATFSLETHDVVRLHQDGLRATGHTIVIGYSGIINDNMHGMYPCYYEHDGVKKELLATQFESHHAREVFPCIDEPAAKATFDVTLSTEPNITVLGNMPIKLQRHEGDWLVTQFDTSPRMSTYLLAWVIGELHKTSGQTNGGVEVNIWATPAQPARSLTFALDIATRTIDFFNEYFGVPYPLPKSDHVALPDFSSGAMENWGLITYREVALLVDPEHGSLESRQQAALVIAHELSHQWFGNLVTMQWWNDLWLNESFANMMEYVAIDALEPDWKVWLDHASYEVVQALRRDSLAGVQAIQVDVTHPDEISTLFDPSIVYAKGGRLLRMLQVYIGDKALQKGLKIYFMTYAYKNTVADDLWRCLSDASGYDISRLMHAWITQPGYPVVHVGLNKQSISLRQEQFFIGDHPLSSRLWPIPLAASDERLPALMTDAQLVVDYPADVTRPLILNTDSPSHYITHYDRPLLERIIKSLPDASDIDRLKLLHEYTLLAQAELVPSTELLALLNSYRHEQNEAVWGMITLAINELKKFVEVDEAAEKALRRFAGELARPQYMRLGWSATPSEPEQDTKLRSLIISLMLYGEDSDALTQAQQMYNTIPVQKLDPNLRVAILAAAVRAHQPTSIIDDLLRLHRQTSSGELREDIAAALTSTKEGAVIEKLLQLITDSSIVRRQDFTRWFVWLLRNRYGRRITWQWFQAQWPWIESTFSSDKSYDIYPRYIAGALMTAQELAEYKAFFQPLTVQPALKRNIEVGIIEFNHRVALIERDGPAVRQALLDL